MLLGQLILYNITFGMKIKILAEVGRGLVQ